MASRILYPILTILLYSNVPVINLLWALKFSYAGKVFEYKKSSLKIFNCLRSDIGTSVQEGKNNDAPHDHDIPQTNFLLDKLRKCVIKYDNIKYFYEFNKTYS